MTSVVNLDCKLWCKLMSFSIKEFLALKDLYLFSFFIPGLVYIFDTVSIHIFGDFTEKAISVIILLT